MKVLVTCPPMLGLFDEFIAKFKEHDLQGVPAQVTQVMTEDELIAILPGYDGWIIGDDPATRRVFEAGVTGKLKAAVKWGVGTDNVDFKACKDLGIPIINTPGVFGNEVADVALAYLLGLSRHTYAIDRAIRDKGEWPKPAGVSLWNKTVAVVGYGDIGQATIRRLRAFDLDVIAYDPFATVVETNGLSQAIWPDRLAEADFLIFTCPLTDDTRHMFNADILLKLKRGVRIINVARGPIIDEIALVAGLEDGTVGSAALDVFEIEPLQANSPLRRFHNLIYGSHNGSNSVDAVRKVSHMAIEKIAGFLSDVQNGKG